MAGLVNFENEAEVKEFLDNLGVEYSFQCYKEKDPEGNNSRRCHPLTGAELRKRSSRVRRNESHSGF